MLDQVVVDNLRIRGANIEAPREIEFFLYFPSEATADEAALRLEDRGFDTDVSPPLADNKWLCFATIEMMPDPAALMRLREQFDSLAELLGGEYDGWGTGLIVDDE